MTTISKKTKWVQSSGHRGYNEPLFWVAGANDTGTWSDSPCPSGVCKHELRIVKKWLRRNGIKFRQMVCTTSNVFCVHRYIVVSAEDLERAMVLVTQRYKEIKNETRLLYIREEWPTTS